MFFVIFFSESELSKNKSVGLCTLSLLQKCFSKTDLVQKQELPKNIHIRKREQFYFFVRTSDQEKNGRIFKRLRPDRKKNFHQKNALNLK